MRKPRMKKFQNSLQEPDQFTLTYELVPSRGGRADAHERALTLARDAAADDRLTAVSITENAGGHPVLSPEVLGIEIKKLGLDVIIHLSCKDKNRNQMESQLFAWDREGLRNLLVIAGDYPQKGYRGHPKPVFDLDTIQALDLISRLNRDPKDRTAHPPTLKKYQPTAFYKGVALSPFKFLESELMMQYMKLMRKVENGADYVITQIGFDARKFHELLLFMKQNHIHVPVLGNVFIPNMTVAKLMYKGMIPGCVITDALYEEMWDEAQSADGGKKARLKRASRLLTILKGLGYAGAHIGGPGLTYKDIASVISEADRSEKEWRDFIPKMSYWPEKRFYLYEKDNQTGLNREEPSKHGKPHSKQLSFLFARMMHTLLFSKNSPLFSPAKKTCLALEKTRLANGFAQYEHVVKFLLFSCRNCGDCVLSELAFLCPQAGCAKYMLNGPCGGSRNGWCEVYPGRKPCFYVRVYERLKACHEETKLNSGLLPPRDWVLNQTSSWINFYKGIDHTNPKK